MPLGKTRQQAADQSSVRPDGRRDAAPTDSGGAETTRVDLALRLRTARQMAGLTQGQVARMLDLHRPSVSEAEAGRRRVQAQELAEYARIYGVSPSWLAGFGPDQLEARDPRVELAARELGKLKPEDLDRVLHLLAALRSEGEPSR